MNINKSLFEIANKLQRKGELLSKDDLQNKLETIGNCAEMIGPGQPDMRFPRTRAEQHLIPF